MDEKTISEYLEILRKREVKMKLEYAAGAESLLTTLVSILVQPESLFRTQ